MHMVLVGLVTFSMSFSTVAIAAGVTDAEVAAVEATGFKVFDSDNDGKISAMEIAASAGQVFAGLDADSSGGASIEEFQIFNLGFAPLAEKNSRAAEYGVARETIFARWDMNGDKQLSQSEMVASMLLEGMAAANAGMDQVSFGNSQFMMEMKATLK